MRVLSKKRVLQKSLYFFFAAALTIASGNVQASTQPYITSHQINFGTGNKYLTATDVRLSGPGPRLSVTRTYNSQSDESSVLGYGWTASLTEKLIIATDITLVQSGGRHVTFMAQGSEWINETGSQRIITAVSGGYQLVEPRGTVKLFDSTGLLLSKTDRNANTATYTYTGSELSSISTNFGKTLTFTYSSGKLSSVTSPLGTVSYTYDTNDNLTTITKPDTTTITYIYDDPNDAQNLTGILNEDSERILTVEYDTSDRVTLSKKANGAEEVTLTYPATYLREVTNSLGVKTTYNLDVLHGIVKVDSFDGPGCSSCGSSSDTSYLYDDRFQVLKKTDANGIITEYTYDTQGNKLTTTEAATTTSERLTTKTYTAENRVATITTSSIANPGQNRRTTLDYDANGNLLTRTETGYTNSSTSLSKTTTYTYNSTGQVTTINGPLTAVNDTVTLTYYANESDQGDNRGQLYTVTNSLGHTTTYGNYNVHGQAETLTDANGVITTRSYTADGLLASSTTGGVTTSYTYNNTDELVTITLPGNRVITYTYTANGHIESITDNGGSSITYSYDTEGHRIGEEVKDPTDALTRYVDFEYNDAGKIQKVILPVGDERTSDYDTIGNLVETVNATGMQTTYGYDALNRLLTIIEPGNSTTSYTYDSHDNITLVTDAVNKVTTFTHDDFGRRLTRTAPDTGLTSYSYDLAGNLLTLTDAKDQTTGFEYDVLNRPTRQFYDDKDILFTYDLNPNGIGRLSIITDEQGSRSFLYNSLGLLESETRILDSTSYTTAYSWETTTGDLDTIEYPSGSTVSYTRGSDGTITAVSLDGTTLINAITRLPFGPVKGAQLAGTIPLTREYDQRYNIATIQASLLDYTYTRDAEGHVKTISGVLAPTANIETTDYTYDTNNNRLTDTTGSTPTTYIYDANGNITSDGSFTFTYDELNRIIQVEKDSALIATYGYDSSNRRVVKTVGATTIHYHYDLNSQLIAETLVDGTLLREYIYLEGEPLALKEYQNNPGIYYYINDHLGTPQQLIDASGVLVWQAAYLPFGEAQVVTESVGNNIRFPGQYYDSETGLHYNWHRFYDPTTGRYISADPIGLEGGLNLYSYANQNPVNFIDPEGLKTCGSGWNEPIVPDNPFGFCFSSCCAAHDKCYGCDGKRQGKSKKQCDDEFKQCMYNACNKVTHKLSRGSCKHKAQVYHDAVDKYGQGAFNNARQQQCCTP